MRSQVSEPVNGRRLDGTALRPFFVPQLRATDLARAAGCIPQFVRAVISGRKPVSARLLNAARDLDIPVDEIWPERDEGNDDTKE